jgi:hypothetical protein
VRPALRLPGRPDAGAQSRKKGKVEAGVKYIKRNFFAARRAELDAAVLGRELPRWTREIAGQRRHGTTQRRPLAVFTTVEQPALRPLPTQPYVPNVWQEATVHPDAHVCVGRALYSVPWRRPPESWSAGWHRGSATCTSRGRVREARRRSTNFCARGFPS